MEWNFGFGLSYSTVEYSDFTLSASSGNEFDFITVSAKVTNTGDRAMKESVLLFVSDVYRLVEPEYKLLKRY